MSRGEKRGKGRYCVEDLGLNGWIILKLTLEIGCEDGDITEFSRDAIQLRAIVKEVMNQGVLQKTTNFLNM
jgi:hypothetical protein